MIVLCEDSVILSVKLKNALVKKAELRNMDITVTLKNISINGDKRGCSGFIVNNENGSIVYVNTEKSVYGGISPYLYRYANSTSDYTGYHNRYAKTLDELVNSIIELLKQTPLEAKDFRF